MLAAHEEPVHLASPAARTLGAVPRPLISWPLAGTVTVSVFGVAIIWADRVGRAGLWSGMLVGVAPAVLLLVMALAGSHLLELSLGSRQRAWPWMRHLASQMVPLVLLTTAYPLAEHRSSLHIVGGVPLRTLLLAVSLTVPWVGQVVCMPLYASITRDLPAVAEDRAALAQALADRMPGAWPSTLLVATVVSAGMSFTLDFGPAATAAFVVSLALHLVFMQLLVLPVLGRRHGLWAAAWTGYALGVFLDPGRWWLPPVAGVVIVSVALVRDLPERPATTKTSGSALELGKGALLGATLWVDKLLLFVRRPETFPASLAFLALVPALLTYNYYFTRVAPRTEALVGELHQSMQSDSPATYAVVRARLTSFVEGSMKTVLLLGAALSLATTVLESALDGSLAAVGRTGGLVSATVPAEMLLWNWESVGVALLAYQLAYLGSHKAAFSACGLHALLVAAVFALGMSTTTTYLALSICGALVLLPALVEFERQWAHPDHALFWRQAVHW